ncbi:hypothetical protein CAAN3_13S02102 [[Candida] anglica]
MSQYKKSTPNGIGAERPSTPGKSQIGASSLRKLLSSHSSIYNALNNPDLDGPVSTSPDLIGSPRFSPDLQFSMTSWQSIGDRNQATNRSGSPSVTAAKRPTTASILSSVSSEDSRIEPDDNCDSTIVIPYPKKVMVFETDEEEDDDETLGGPVHKKISPIVPISPSIPNFKLNQDSFVMPRMTVSDNYTVKMRKHSRSQKNSIRENEKQTSFLKIVVLSSSAYEVETVQLVDNLRKNVASYSHRLCFSQISLQKLPLDVDDEEHIRDSNLIFLVNDGSFVLVDCLSKIFPPGDNETSSSLDDLLPKLTIINMITVNYFVNLFELINSLQPYQIWKISSLSNELLNKNIKEFVELELNGPENGKDSEQSSLSLTFLNSSRSRTVYSSLISSKRPDYKRIEKKFKTELQLSASNLNDVDPLSISAKCNYVNIVTSLVNSISPVNNGVVSGKVWILCSFALGVGLGISIANGAATIIGLSVCNTLSSPWILVQPKQPEQLLPMTVGSVSGISSSPIIDSIKTLGDNIYISSTEVLRNFAAVVSDTALPASLTDLHNLFTLSTEYLRSFNYTILECVSGGLEKVVGLITYINF